MNSLFITTMSIFDRYRVNSAYLFKIVPTNALTEIPILSASSSKTLDKSKPNLKDLVIVSERASELVIPPKLLSSKRYSPR